MQPQQCYELNTMRNVMCSSVLSPEFGPPRCEKVTVVSATEVLVDFLPPKDSGMCVANYTGCLQDDDHPEASPVCLPAPNDYYWTNWGNNTEACTNYTLQLTVFSTDDRNASTTVTFTSGADEAEDLKVVNVTSNSAKSSSAKLTWNVTSPTECVEYQELIWTYSYWYPACGANVSTDAREYVMEDLSPCTWYEASVTQHAHTPSVVSQVKFFSADNGVNKPKDLKVANVTTFSPAQATKLTWTVVVAHQCMKSQQVTWALADGSGTNNTADVETDDEEFTFEDLDPCREYEAVVTQNSLAYTTHSSVRFYSPSNVTYVLEMKFNCSGAAEATLRYWAPEASPLCVDHYSACWTLMGDDSRNWTCQDQGGSGYLTLRLSNLKYRGAYSFSVTPVAPDQQKYVTSYLDAIATCSGGMLRAASSVTALVLFTGALYKLLIGLQ